MKKVRKIFKDSQSKSEPHLTEYTKDKQIKNYFKILDAVINSDFRINILIVNNEEALSSASKLDLIIEELRNLFYIKIPERH